MLVDSSFSMQKSPSLIGGLDSAPYVSLSETSFGLIPANSTAVAPADTAATAIEGLDSDNDDIDDGGAAGMDWEDRAANVHCELFHSPTTASC